MSSTYFYAEKRSMGIGPLMDPGVYIKRKYRWTLGVDFTGSTCPNLDYIPEHYVKSANRPNLEIEELELNFLNQKFWIPGKGAWQTLSVTYYDIAVLDIGLTNLWTWIDSIYQVMDDKTKSRGGSGKATLDRYQASRPSDYIGDTMITMYDGCGVWIENWDLRDSWPQGINWGELDYSSNDEANIEVTLRFSDVTLAFNPMCSTPPDPGCCSACSDESGSGAEAAGYLGGDTIANTLGY